MGKFLTTPVPIEQVNTRGKYKLLGNTLYKDDDGSIYLAWRGYETDNFTWLRSNDWDIRCSHIHDIGCQYKQVVKLKISEEQLRKLRYLQIKGSQIICRDINIKFLEVVDINGTWINNLFYRMLRDADCPKTPKIIQLLYRAGVSLNFKWFLKRKNTINLNNIYEKSL